MSLTTDPNDPRLNRGGPQHEAYLVLTEEERAKGFVRPLRRSYSHTGVRPRYPLRELTDDEKQSHAGCGYVKFEVYPAAESPLCGRFWTAADLRTCGAVTTMALPLCETYARSPKFYGSTFCVGCGTHRRVEEFRWIEPNGELGPVVGE